ALVGHRVGQRVRLDEVHDAQLAVLRVALERDDRVDVLRLVLGEARRGGRDLAVGGQRRAVTAGQVVDDDFEQHRGAAGAGLGDRVVQLRLQAQVGAVAGDGADVVHPDRGLVGGDLGFLGVAAVSGGLGLYLGDVVRVEVRVGAGERVGHV